MEGKMESRLNKQIEPICKFGPGGDFVSVWPKEPTFSLKPAPNRLTKLLNSIAEIINATLGSEFDSATEVPTDIAPETNRILYHEEKLKYAAKNTKADKPAYPTAATVIKNNRRLSSEPMLFADDWGVGGRAGHKSKHHIRAYRRTAKKRPALSLPGQGSLFEANFKSARTA